MRVSRFYIWNSKNTWKFCFKEFDCYKIMTRCFWLPVNNAFVICIIFIAFIEFNILVLKNQIFSFDFEKSKPVFQKSASISALTGPEVRTKEFTFLRVFILSALFHIKSIILNIFQVNLHTLNSLWIEKISWSFRIFYMKIDC